MNSKVKWNNELRLIISDVDETIADLYVNAEPEMINKLEPLLEEGKILFLLSGQSVQSIKRRIVDHIKLELRKRIIIGHCSGTEVWGFNENGELRENAFYSLYEDSLSKDQKNKWREIVNQIVEELHLEVYPTMPVSDFEKKTNGNPFAIMLEDRGPQITFEVVNGYDLSLEKSEQIKSKLPKLHDCYDFRIPILERAEILFEESKLPITPRLAGVFAIDFVLRGVSKTTAVKYIIEHESILKELGLTKETLENPKHIEVWGDKFSTTRGGTDRHISEALSKQVRSITFREENPTEFLEDYNIVVWDGKEHLHHGLLEFLKSR